MITDLLMSGNAVTPVLVKPGNTHTLAEICKKARHCVLKSTTSKDPKDDNYMQNNFTEKSEEKNNIQNMHLSGLYSTMASTRENLFPLASPPLNIYISNGYYFQALSLLFKSSLCKACY